MASTTAANAHCARFGADKKTLLSAKRAGFNGGARGVQVAKVGACRARGPSAVRAAGSAFIPEEFQSPARDRKVVLPGDPEFDRARGVAGLSAKQILELREKITKHEKIVEARHARSPEPWAHAHARTHACTDSPPHTPGDDG